MDNLSINTYRRLIFQFVNEEISADQFEKDYMSLWRECRDKNWREFKDKVVISEDGAADIVDQLFTALDCYCGNPDLRDEDDIDEAELLEIAKSSLKKLLDY